MKAFLYLLAVTTVASFARADIGPGDPAPALSIKSWIKGEPVTSLAKDKTYVVEFWATWCGPCVESIPHLTEVAHKNPDVIFIGVSVWEDDTNGSIKKFVDEKGAMMDYRVGYSGNQDGMAKSWMKEAAQNGIPAAFIVKNGVIQWIGHPMEVEGPLTEVKAGTFDVAKFRVRFDQRAIKTRRNMAANQGYSEAIDMYKAGKRQAAKDKIAATVDKYPESKDEAETIRFQWLAEEDPTAWAAAAKKMLVSGKSGDLDMVLNLAVYEAVAPRGDHTVSRNAMELVLDTVPKHDKTILLDAVSVYGYVGDYSKAIGFIDKLLAVLPDDSANADLRKAMTTKRAEYETRLSKH